jgi:hypothetical protein
VTETTDWRDDPRWRLIEYDAAFYEGNEPPPSPPAEAELAQPDCWASLYVDRKLVATWSRLATGPESPTRPTDDRATIPLPT